MADVRGTSKCRAGIGDGAVSLKRARCCRFQVGAADLAVIFTLLPQSAAHLCSRPLHMQTASIVARRSGLRIHASIGSSDAGEY